MRNWIGGKDERAAGFARVVAAGVLLALAVCSWQAVPPAFADTLMPGNYCVSCHTADDPRLGEISEWRGVAPQNIACPAVRAYREDILYSEQLLVATARAQLAAPASAPTKATARLDQLAGDVETLRTEPVTSLAAFHAQAQSIRFQGAKAYSAFNQAIDARKRTYVLLAGVLVTLLVVGSLVWGLRNTLKARPASGWRDFWRPGWRTPMLAALVLAAFALPVFRVPAATVATPTPEERAVQTALDETDRAADVADRALARAWMLARAGAGWSKIDITSGEKALAAALVAEEEAQRYSDALWGQAQAAYEAGIGLPATQEEAALRAAELEAARGRAWALRLIAAEWAAVDKARAAEILNLARARARANSTGYGALDLAAIDAEKLDGRQLEHLLHPPSVVQPGATVESVGAMLETLTTETQKAEALRFIAATTGAREDFDRALAMAEAARVRGDALAPAEASLALGLAMLNRDHNMAAEAFAQAYHLALGIPVKYP